RLSPELLPSRLAASLRFLIDPAYRQAQSSDAQLHLQKQIDKLQGTSLLQALRGVQAALAKKERLGQAFRLDEGLVLALRQEYPHLVQRLSTFILCIV